METVSDQLQGVHRDTISQNKALKNQLNKLEEDIKKLREPDKPRSRLASIVGAEIAEPKGTSISWAAYSWKYLRVYPTVKKIEAPKNLWTLKSRN